MNRTVGMTAICLASFVQMACGPREARERMGIRTGDSSIKVTAGSDYLVVLDKSRWASCDGMKVCKADLKIEGKSWTVVIRSNNGDVKNVTFDPHKDWSLKLEQGQASQTITGNGNGKLTVDADTSGSANHTWARQSDTTIKHSVAGRVGDATLTGKTVDNEDFSVTVKNLRNHTGICFNWAGTCE